MVCFKFGLDLFMSYWSQSTSKLLKFQPIPPFINIYIYIYSYNPLSAVEVYNMVSRSWRMIASLKSSVVGPSLHTYKGNLALFGNNSIQIYDGVTWAIASESLVKKFDMGVLLKVPCH